MATAREEIQSLLNRLPADCSIEDIQYHLYVIEKIRAGLEAADAKEILSQDDAESRLSKWLTD